MVNGLRSSLAARAEIKSEFRIDRTMVRARGNNPLKFSADDDDALAALLGAGRQTDMDAAAAISEALRDMRLHELASVAAMQAAVRTLLDQFDPERIRVRAEEGGGLAMMPAQRRARAWQVFEKLHAETIRALTDDFDSVFGKAFARAYEKAIRDAREQSSGDV
jgi:type VI secretion system FHA domain protein